ncbi:MAG: DUF1640 domain-containing protein [Nitrospinae bacterium]|nr:DUF1640 domain-containing protein [Nitrospinota bacterium]
MGRAIVFDTHAYVKKLKAVGFTEEQAETLAASQAELIDERLATKYDLKELDNAHKKDIAELRRDIKEMEMRLTIKLGAIVTTGIVIVTALVKLL